ncbi:MAG: hypothetical protein JKX80_02890 [Candidatus Pacebacteria bacterium]|nr:hypothetical protein [Candidatus Paceibacterota bacterium]
MRSEYPLIAPAIMADEWDSLVVQIESIAKSATHAQIDVMDGHLVPPSSFPYNETTLDGRQIPHAEDINFEVHLMVQQPQEIGKQFIGAGVKRVTAQIEGFQENQAPHVFKEWKETGIETGVSILLDTPLEEVIALVESGYVSIVQVMSINRIGYQGEEFDERALARIKKLREQFPDVTISVDGGVNADTLKSLFDAGVNIFGIGSAIMKTHAPEEELVRLQKLVSSFAHDA